MDEMKSSFIKLGNLQAPSEHLSKQFAIKNILLIQGDIPLAPLVQGASPLAPNNLAQYCKQNALRLSGGALRPGGLSSHLSLRLM